MHKNIAVGSIVVETLLYNNECDLYTV